MESPTPKKSLLNKLIDKAIDTSAKVMDLKNDILDLAHNVNILTKSVVGVAQAVQSHHQAISELYAIQAQILKVMNGNSLDSKLSEGKKKEGRDKPN
jgi:hypothetical protein